jgi:O-succinylbenzoic acid--CoA ligase
MNFIIEDRKLKEAEVRELVVREIPVDIPDWQIDIYNFLQQWWDTQDFIEVKTSGSTGDPKILRLKKSMMIASAEQTCEYFNIDSGSKLLLCLPASHIGGKMMIVRALISNADLHSIKPSRVPKFKEKIDFSAMTPYQVGGLLEDSPKSFDRIQNLIIGGSAIPPKLRKKITKLKPKSYATYGMTETASHVALNDIKSGNEKFQALEHVTFDKDERSRLVINAAHLGLYGLQTNDVVELDGVFAFQWKGRFDEVINSGGIKIFPAELEIEAERVTGYPCLVFGVKHDKLGEAVHMLVEAPAKKQKAILEKLKTGLDKFQKPRKIDFVEKFERSELQKVRKNLTINKWKEASQLGASVLLK